MHNISTIFMLFRFSLTYFLSLFYFVLDVDY